MKIVFRGTSDAHGVPRLYCECQVCQEARATGENRRFRPSIQLYFQQHDTVWVDCGPDWYTQMEQAGQRVISHMLITHPHFDHIGGLPQWYDQCRYTDNEPRLYAAKEVISEVQTRFPWLSGGIQFIAIEDGVEFEDWTLRTWRVNHGRNGYSYAFRFDHKHNATSVVYCPDSIALTEQQQQLLYGVDRLIIGASFYKEPFAFETRSLYDVTELLQLHSEWRPKQMWITHMSHDIDIRGQHVLPAAVDYAKTGTILEV